MAGRKLVNSGLQGVLLAVEFNGEGLEIENDGYIGRLSTGRATGPALVKVYVDPPGHLIFGLNVDGQKNVVLKSSRTLVATPPFEEGGKYYQMQMKIPVDGPNGYELARGKSFRLLWLKPAGGVELWEVGLISQTGEFFLVCQKNYQFQGYLDDECEIVYPDFEERWPQLADFLREVLDYIRHGVFPPVFKWRPALLPNAADLDEGLGMVKWFNLFSGTGSVYILTNDGEGVEEAKVYWAEVPKRPRLRFLVPGEHVKFKEVRSPRGRGYTEFNWELVGVTPVL